MIVSGFERTMHPLILVFIGGGLGSICRFMLSFWVTNRMGLSFPYGTLAVNLLGCLLIGAFSGLPQGLSSLNPGARLACITGFLGGFTTFSAYESESFQLLLEGALLKAGLNLGLSMALGLSGVALGHALSRTVCGWLKYDG